MDDSQEIPPKKEKQEGVDSVVESNTVPLGYETPCAGTSGKRPPGKVAMTFACIGGFIVGVGGVLFLGMIVVGFVESSHALGGFRAKRLAAGILYGLFSCVAISLTIRLMMRPGWRTIDRWEALGVLFGAALSLSLSFVGICFEMI